MHVREAHDTALTGFVDDRSNDIERNLRNLAPEIVNPNLPRPASKPGQLPDVVGRGGAPASALQVETSVRETLALAAIH